MPKAFVNTLDVPSSDEIQQSRNLPDAPATLAQDGQKPSAFVDGGSVVAFTANVSGQNRQDVLNSTLLAQLASDKQFSRETQVMDWYNNYSTVLGKIGWVTEGFNWDRYSSQAMSFTMDQAVVELIGAALTGPEGLVVTAALKALNDLPKDDGRLKIFNHSASSDTAGNFQISACDETNGAVSMTTMAFYYNAQQQTTDVLFFNFSSSSTTLNKATVKQSLNSQVYAAVRDAVLTKLGVNAQNFVLDLDI